MDERFIGSVEHLTETVYGKDQLPGAQQGQTGYDARKDIEKLKGGLPMANISNSRMPSEILESIVRNPLIDTSTADSAIDDFAERIAASGISKSRDIMEKLDMEEGKQKKVNEVRQNSTVTTGQSGIDYEMIKMIVEGAVEKKLNEMRGTLNEGRDVGTQPKLTVMRLSDNLMFMDSDNNVYECKMVYKGKSKIRKK